MSSPCPSFTFSCSIWFCCGGSGSTKEPEQDPKKQYQPPSPQVITTVAPDHLKPTTTTGQQPPAPPPPPPPAAEPVPVHDRPSPPTIPLHYVPSTETYYPAPQTTQQQTWPQTLLPPALPPSVPAPQKVHDLWPPSTQLTPSHVQCVMHKAPPQSAPLASQPQPLQAPWPARQPTKCASTRVAG